MRWSFSFVVKGIDGVSESGGGWGEFLGTTTHNAERDHSHIKTNIRFHSF